MKQSLLEDWLERQCEFPECLRPRDFPAALEERRRHLAEGGLTLVGGEEAFVAWREGMVEEDTGHPVAGLWAVGCGPEHFPPLLKSSIETLPDHHLLAEIPVKTDWQLRGLAEAGFQLHRYRLTREPETHRLDTPRQGRFSLRLGTELDRPLLCSLATAHARHTLPPGRQEQLKEYTTAILRRFAGLDIGPESPFDLLIAEERATRLAVGYLLLETVDEKTASLFDIAVKQSHWGRYVAQFLVRATENLMVDSEMDLLVTEISAANRRSYVTACRSLGFIPRHQMWIHESL